MDAAAQVEQDHQERAEREEDGSCGKDNRDAVLLFVCFAANVATYRGRTEHRQQVQAGEERACGIDDLEAER